MHKNNLVLFLLAWVPAHSCTQNVQLDKIDAYLNASTVEEKSKYTSDNFRSYFISREDGGENKAEALASFQKWDGPMHPHIKILSYSFHDSIWTVRFNEQNDFTKPIGYPGWKGRTTFVFDPKGFIRETTYVPDSTNLPYKPYLKPAIDWLKANMPQELDEVYQNGKLVQTAEAANKWRELLNKWESQKH